ncbi:MAG: DUF5131 family protein [Okeania sp. SIO2D1]|nr:DUF5131 family protein [Okeania sp. SIO2D1]
MSRGTEQNNKLYQGYFRPIKKPIKLKKAHQIFVNSMSDLFHEQVPLEYIQQVFDVIEKSVSPHLPSISQKS